MGNARSLGRNALVGTLASLATLACGGGGGGGPSTSVSFEQATATLAEDAPSTGVVVVLHTVFPSLTEELTVEVVDAGTGTAGSGSDYAVFAPQTLTFPVGALDGDQQSVSLDPLDDLLVEAGNESVRLRLQNVTGGGLSGSTQHVTTITDIHAAVVAFATNGSDTPDEATGPQAVALELDCGAGVSLGVNASVRVADLRTGSASTAVDYAPFATQTVTFLAGQSDGALQTVNLQVSDDGNVEGAETVVLGLSAPSATCTIGAFVHHTLTILDDDNGGPAGFAASEGPAGTGNALSYNEALDLGSETVGAGPNTGTLVRVTNIGGAPMTLGAPSLGGAHQNDFAVDVESSSFQGTNSSGGSAFAALGDPLPLLALAPDGGPGVALRVDALAVEELRGLAEVQFHGLELPDVGPVSVALRRRPLPLAPGAKLIVDGREIAGGLRTLTGDLQLWSGEVLGFAGSRVFLVLTPASASGFVELPQLPDRLVHVLSEGTGRVRLVRASELDALGLVPPVDFCEGERLAPGAPPRLGFPPTGGDPPTAALTIADCRLALETDFQFFQKFASPVLLSNYVIGLVGAVSDQYATDVQTTLSIASLGYYTNANDDPWDTQETPGANTSMLLDEFRAAWGTGWASSADLAHFLSGADLGGGVAYLDQLCSPSFGFGVSADLGGNINWATWTGASSNSTWDFVVVAHELGHNFGSSHTHDYCPPLDECWANCNSVTSCTRGTIMSYCHAQCGGMQYIDLWFHPVTADIMRANVNASCLDDASLAPNDFVQYRVRFNPLTDTGTRNAQLDFPHGATNTTQPFRVQLSGAAN